MRSRECVEHAAFVAGALASPTLALRPPDFARALAYSSVSCLALAVALAAGGSASAQTALPKGGVVSSGGAIIGAPADNALTINQTSARAVIDWRSFSIGQGATVTFQQPDAQSAVLNRVNGSAPTSIAGALNANGQVYIVNPNGIAITQTGAVKVGGGFVGSTLGISNNDFQTGRLHFTGVGASAPVSNAGTIVTAPGGIVGLLGGSVSNSGTISAPLGRIAVGSGEQATLDLNGDGFLQVAVPTPGGGVNISGKVKAAGGRVEIKAAAAAQAARDVVNISGTVSASSAHRQGGVIVIDGGGGATTVTGVVTARAKSATGGAIAIGGQTVKLKGARIDASGATGGGTIAIGGGLRGAQAPGLSANSVHTSADAATTLKTDAGKRGHGGLITLWGEATATFAGKASARGGAQGGDGGVIETSTHGLLTLTGTVDASARKGVSGQWLLDPADVTIVSGSGTDANESAASGTWTPTSGSATSTIYVANINSVLAAGTSVTIQTTNSGTSGGGLGNITLNAGANISTSTGANLTLNAANTISLSGSVTLASGTLTLSAGAAASAVTATGAINVGSFNLTQGAWSQNSASLPSFTAGKFTVGASASFLRAAGGSGAAGSPYLLTDVYGLQGMGTSTTYLAANYKLANDIDASSTSSWNSGAGFAPIGPSSGTPFKGTFDGANNLISGLTINLPAATTVGMFGYTDGATVKSVSLLGVNITGWGAFGAFGAGALIGAAEGASVITNVTVTGTVAATATGGGNLGGIIGDLGGTATFSYGSSSASVTAPFSVIGGAVGGIEANASASYIAVSGSVTGTGSAGKSVGGVAGYIAGTLSNSYATGDVTGNDRVGGLVGNFDGGTIVNSYAAGNVSGTGSNVGGVVGQTQSAGSVTKTYWDTTTSGQSVAAGSGSTSGMTGKSTANMQTQATFSGWDFASTWYLTSGFYPILRNSVTILGAAGGDLTVSTSANSATNYNNTSLQNMLGVGGVLISTSSGKVTVSSAVSWSSANNLTLSASNGVIVNAGLTNSGAGSSLDLTTTATAGVSGTGALANSGTVTLGVYNASGAGTLSGVVSGAGSLVKSGSGAVTLSGANTYSGGTTVNAGTLVANVNTSQNGIGTGAASIATGATLQINNTNATSTAFTIANVFTGAGTLNLNFNDPDTTGTAMTGLTGLTGNIILSASGSTGDKLFFNADTTIPASLTINAGATLYATSNVTFSGGVSVTGSGNWEGLGAIRLDVGGVLGGPVTLLGDTTVGIFIGSGTIAGNISSGVTGAVTLTLQTQTVAIAGNLTLSGAISDGAGTLALKSSQAGTAILTGVNSYTGATTISAGTIQIGGSGSLGQGAYAGGVSIGSGATLQFSSSAAQTLSGIISGAGALTKDTSAASTLTLSGANTYSGVTTVSAGILEFQNQNSLYNGSTASWTASNIVVASGATLALAYGGSGQFTSANIQTLAALGSASGGFKDGAFLGIDTGSGSQTYANVIANPNSGANALGLAKLGANTLTLTGANTYSGATTISAGTLQIGAGGASGSLGTGGVTDNGALVFNLSGALSVAGNISGSGTLSQSGTGTTTLSGANTYSGGTNINAGTLNAGSSGALGSTGTIGFAGGTLQYSAANQTDYSSRFSSAGGQPWSIDTNSQNVTLASNLLGAASSLTKLGAGGLTLTGANGYSGATAVNAGTLQIGNGGAGLMGSGGVNVASGAILYFNTTSYQGGTTISAALTGAGLVEVAGASATSQIRLAGDNSGFSGTIQVDSGARLNLQAATAGSASADFVVNGLLGEQVAGATFNFGSLAGSGLVSLAGGAANSSLIIGGNNHSTTFAGAIGNTSDATSLTKVGSGTLILTGANTYTQSTTVSAGVLQIGDGSVGSISSTSSVGTASGATLALNLASGSTFSKAIANAGTVNFLEAGGSTLTVSQGISGAGMVTQIGAGTTTLSGANTYTGATTVSAGTLSLAGSLNVGANTATISVASGATLAGAGVITAATLAASGSGTVSLTGANAIGAVSTSGSIGAFALTDAQSVSLGSMSSSGAIAINATGAASDVRLSNGAAISSSASGAAIVLAAGRNFINNAGASALSAASGRWLVYSSSSGGDTFGNLDSGNTAVWNATYATLPPASVVPSGNRYLFAFQPTLTFTASSTSKAYGVSYTPTFSVSGYQSGSNAAFAADTAATAYSGAPSLASAGALASAHVIGSPYSDAISIGSLTSSAGYGFAFTNGTLTVNPVALTITASNGQMNYGASSLPSLSAGYAGFVNGDDASKLSTAPTLSTTATAYNGAPGSASHVGSYATNAAGAVDPDYTISYVPGTLTVNPVALTITASNASKTYDGLPFSDGDGVNFSGFVNGDNASVLAGALSYGGSALSAVNAGSYRINTFGLASHDYAIAFAPGTLTIGARALTISANPQTMTYGDTAPALTYTVGGQGLVHGDGLTGALSTVASSTANVGVYAISQGTLFASPNYLIVAFLGSRLTVAPRLLEVIADNQFKFVGRSLDLGATRFTTSGLVNADSVFGVTLTSDGAASSAGVATYPITPSNAKGAGLSNYQIDYRAAPVGLKVEASPPIVIPPVPPYTPPPTPNPPTPPTPTGPSTVPEGPTVVATPSPPRPAVSVDRNAPPAAPRLDLRRSAPPQSVPSGSSPATSCSGGGGAPASDPAVGTASPAACNAHGASAAPPPVMAPADPSFGGACANGGASGDGAGSGKLASQTGSNETPGCGAAGGVAKTHAAVIGPARITLAEISRSIDEGLKTFRGAANATRLMISFSFTSATLGVTASFIGWLLRGGMLLGALGSSLRTLQGFDPLVIVIRGRRKTAAGDSPVELLFENIRPNSHLDQSSKS